MAARLDFEAGLGEIDAEIEKARVAIQKGTSDAEERLASLQEERDRREQELYANLTPWHKVQIARHRERPFTLDYLRWAFGDFVELHGDRRFGDDPAIVGGPAFLDDLAVMVVGHQKGHNTKESVARNFGLARPEGFRKAQRLFRQAEKLGMPVVTLLDTSGGSPAREDEERGQVEAIASSLATMASLRVPIVCAVIGEGGSGGALALGVADRILMLEHAVYSVASPEGAAAIMWRSSSRASDAAAVMGITAQELHRFGIVDEVMPEPFGGAHRNPTETATTLRTALLRHLRELLPLPVGELLAGRYAKYRRIGELAIEGDTRTEGPRDADSCLNAWDDSR